MAWMAGRAGAELEGGVASRLIDKRLGPVSRPTQLRQRQRPAGRPRGTPACLRYVPTDAAEKRFSGHRRSQRKIGGGLPPLTPSPNRQPRHRRQSITTSRDTLDRFLAPGSSTNNPTLTMSNAELASSYAALILADEGVEITVREKPSPRPDPPPFSRSCRIPP